MGFGVLGRLLNIINRLNNNFNKFIIPNKFMVKRCSECGGELRAEPDETLVCKNCGLVSEESLVDVSFAPLSLKKIVDLSHKKMPKRRWGRDVYSRNMKTLSRLARLYLSRDFAEKLISLTIESVSLNYEKNIPKTRNKKIVLWMVFIAWIKYIIDASSNEDSLRGFVPSCNLLLEKLREENPERFDKALSLVNKEKMRIAPNILDVDNRIHYIQDKDSFFNLFYSHEIKVGSEMKEQNIQKVLDSGLFTANLFLKNNINKQIKEGKKIKILSKKNGFFGACCYLACNLSGLGSRPQKEWAEFFHVSESSFDNFLKEIRDTIIVPFP